MKMYRASLFAVFDRLANFVGMNVLGNSGITRKNHND